MRCPDCNKFASYDTDVEPEVDVNIDDDGAVTGTVRIVNACADCGTELKAAELEVEEDFAEDVKEHKAKFPAAKHSLSVELSDASRTDRTADKDRNGKPIKSSRYMKRFYGAEGTLSVTCSCGEPKGDDWSVDLSWSGEVQASGMDEQV